VTTSLLFVCLGNICRSPLAEGLFLHMARRRGVADRFIVDSCGTGDWHVGELADPRSRAVAERHGFSLTHRVRVWDPRRDPTAFDLILAMDRANVRNLLAAGAPAEKVSLIRSFDPALAGRDDTQLEVPDPYHMELEAFDRVYAMLETACAALLDELTRDA